MTAATRLLTVAEAAEIAGLSAERLRQLIRDGDGPAVHPAFQPPRFARISETNLVAWVDATAEREAS